MDSLEQLRFFLKDSIRKSIDFRTSDQSRGVAAPPIQKPYDSDAPRIQLSAPDQWPAEVKDKDLFSAIANRRSRRLFTSQSITLDELSFLLWATQGIRNREGRTPYLRTVPSAGARHSFETYLFVLNVNAVPKGLYRFLPIDNELLFIKEMRQMEQRLAAACFGQRFVARGAVTFVWTTIPYRMEWRYSRAAHRVILIDAGHVCQNLYLACEAINAGTCAVGAYDQEALDGLLEVDGESEFAIYLAPVGVPRRP
jgi:SagB-type dehydrogenase family enzyme